MYPKFAKQLRFPPLEHGRFDTNFPLVVAQTPYRKVTTIAKVFCVALGSNQRPDFNNGGMDLNSHYVNRTDTSFVGEVYLNIHYPEEDDIENIAQVMFLNNNNFH